MEEIEIIKSKISQYRNIQHLIAKLTVERKVLFYRLSGVKAVQYDKPKGNANHNAIEMMKLKLSENIEKFDKKIKTNSEALTEIISLLEEIDKENEKLNVEGVKINPSEVLVCVLCKEKSNQEAIKYFGFKNKMSMSRYIEKVIEGIL